MQQENYKLERLMMEGSFAFVNEIWTFDEHSVNHEAIKAEPVQANLVSRIKKLHRWCVIALS